MKIIFLGIGENEPQTTNNFEPNPSKIESAINPFFSNFTSSRLLRRWHRNTYQPYVSELFIRPDNVQRLFFTIAELLGLQPVHVVVWIGYLTIVLENYLYKSVFYEDNRRSERTHNSLGS